MRVLAVLFALLFARGASGAVGEPVRVGGIPGPFEWRNSPTNFHGDERGLTLVAGASTNWFVSPIDGGTSASSPLLLFKPTDDFVLSAKVTIDAPSQWDAGFLMIYGDDTTWAKLALEVSAYKEPTVVSVVTRGTSDDCNSSTVGANAVYLQVARLGAAFLFYWSHDGRSWRLARAFVLPSRQELRVGFGSQSPIGPGLRAAFSEVRYESRKIRDVFTGHADPPPGPSEGAQPDAERARAEASVEADLARRLQVPLETVRVVETQERTWPDARLGCASRRSLDQPVPVRGFLVVLAVDDRQYVYHTDRGGRFLRCERPGKPLGPIE